MLTLMGIEEGNPLRPVTPSAKTRRVGEHFDSENRVVMDWSSLKAEAVKLAASSFLSSLWWGVDKSGEVRA